MTFINLFTNQKYCSFSHQKNLGKNLHKLNRILRYWDLMHICSLLKDNSQRSSGICWILEVFESWKDNIGVYCIHLRVFIFKTFALAHLNTLGIELRLMSKRFQISLWMNSAESTNCMNSHSYDYQIVISKSTPTMKL